LICISHTDRQFWSYSSASVSSGAAGTDELDRTQLEARVDEEGLRSALGEMDGVARRVDAGEKIESWELHELSRKLRQRDVH
jgi:hypothetical protein